jgi:hypothetical protein
MFLLNGKPLSPDSSFTHNGIQYPSQWLRLSTTEQKEAIGITEEPDPQSYDQRYYWDNGIPKQLEDETVTPEDGEPYTQTGLKTQHIRQTKETANTLLQPTDWYITRNFERNIEVPVGIVSYRAGVIEVSEEREELIELVTTVEELKSLYESSTVGIGTSVVTNPPAMPNWPNINN